MFVASKNLMTAPVYGVDGLPFCFALVLYKPNLFSEMKLRIAYRSGDQIP